MEKEVVFDEKTVRVSDILEQIKKLNQMIALHSNDGGNEFMVNQYLDLKMRFLEELKTLLSEFEIEVLIKNKAA